MKYKHKKIPYDKITFISTVNNHVLGTFPYGLVPGYNDIIPGKDLKGRKVSVNEVEHSIEFTAWSDNEQTVVVYVYPMGTLDEVCGKD